MKKSYQNYHDEIMKLSEETRKKLNEGHNLINLFNGEDQSHIFDNGFYYGYTYNKSFFETDEPSAIDILNKKNKIFENPIYKNATDNEKLTVLNLVVHWLELEIFKIKQHKK